jgi:hypothetical protein
MKRYSLTESGLKRIIKECVAQVLLEKQGIQSPKLEWYIKKHGGVKKGEHCTFLIPYVTDKDVIGPFDPSRIDDEDMGQYPDFDSYLRYERAWYMFEDNPDARLHYLTLNDGYRLYFVTHMDDSQMDSIVDDKVGNKWKRNIGRDGGKTYNWNNRAAEEAFKFDDNWKGFPKDSRKGLVNIARDNHKKTMRK